MIIIGTGGLARETMAILLNNNPNENIIFFDENKNCPSLLYNKYIVITSYNELSKILSNNKFIVCIGNPRIREKLTKKIKSIGGQNANVISKDTSIFQYSEFSEGTIIEPYVGISYGITIGIGCAIHIHASIGHSAKIGNYVNIGPAATIIGPTEIGNYSYIGAKALIMPNLKIGNNVIVKAGTVVNRDLTDYETFLG